MKSTTLHRSSLTKERMTALERSRLINMDMNDIPQYRQHETSNKTSELDVLYRSIEKGLRRQPVKKTPAVYLTLGFVSGVIFMLIVMLIVGLSSMGMRRASENSDNITTIPVEEPKTEREYISGLAEEKYEIKSGDTLDRIALRFYGKYDTQKIEEIQRINNIKNPAALQIGQVIIIPLTSGQ